jgi:magnesium transporter
MQNSTEIKCGKHRWVDVSDTESSTLAALHKQFSFLKLDLEDCTPPLERAKFVIRENYIFLILLFPVYNTKTGSAHVRELDLFIGKDFLVTVHAQALPPITALLAKLKKQGEADDTPNSCGELLYQVLDGLLDACFPMLSDLTNKIDEIEDRMEDTHNGKTINDIFKIKTSIVNFKKALWPQKSILRKLLKQVPKFVTDKTLPDYLEHLVGHTKEIWDDLERNAHTIKAIEDTHVSLLNFRTNNIMRMLTIFAVIVFPLTLFAAIFGMNTVTTPIIGHPQDFWIILGLMFAGTLLMILLFKKKKWVEDRLERTRNRKRP